MNKRDFIDMRYAVHVKGDWCEEDLDTFQEHSERLWDECRKRNPTERTQKTREAKQTLSDPDRQHSKKVIDRWQKVPQVKKNRTKPAEVYTALVKVLNDYEQIPWGAIQKGVINYLEYMEQSGQVQYIPGLQVWINGREWESWQDEKKEQAKADQELFKLRQSWGNATNMLGMNPKSEFWVGEVDRLARQIREREGNS